MRSEESEGITGFYRYKSAVGVHHSQISLFIHRYIMLQVDTIHHHQAPLPPGGQRLGGWATLVKAGNRFAVDVMKDEKTLQDSQKQMEERIVCMSQIACFWQNTVNQETTTFPQTIEMPKLQRSKSRFSIVQHCATINCESRT